MTRISTDENMVKDGNRNGKNIGNNIPMALTLRI
jgi:hypothetical protein